MSYCTLIKYSNSTNETSVKACVEMRSLLCAQECEVRAGRQRVLRGEGEGQPHAEDRLDEEGHGDEGELQAPDDLRGGDGQGGLAGMHQSSELKTWGNRSSYKFMVYG